MATYPREEIEAAWAEYRRRGVETHDWPAWAKMFTDDALYEEHFLGVFDGQKAIEEWIVVVHEGVPGDDAVDRVGGHRRRPHRLLHLEQPARSRPAPGSASRSPTRRSSSTAATASSASRATTTTRPTPSGSSATGCRPAGASDTPQDRSLQGIDDWSPPVPTPAFPREEVEAEFAKYRERAALAVATGDWDQWADQFTDDAHYREHHYGYFRSQQEIRDWIKSVMQPFPTMEFPRQVRT